MRALVWRIYAGLAALSLVLTTTACSSVSADKECNKDEQCDVGRICIESDCIPGCRTDGNCQDDSICLDNECRPYEPALGAEPENLDFGSVLVTCEEVERSANVFNRGAEPVMVSSISLENASMGDFEIRSRPQPPFILEEGGSFEVSVGYAPRDAGVHESNLRIDAVAIRPEVATVSLLGRGEWTPEQIDIFHQPVRPKRDVLFVLDNSESMADEQDALIERLTDFIVTIQTQEVDFYVGVITTQIVESAGFQGDPLREILPGVLVNAPGRPKVVTDDTPDLETAFIENASVGTGRLDGQESGLQAAWMALSTPLVDDPEANAGFLREDSWLFIVFVSDAEDQSVGETGFYADFFRSVGGTGDHLSTYMMAICGDSPDGCQGSGGTAASGDRYIEVAGGFFESICDEDWGDMLWSIIWNTGSLIREFPLSKPPIPETIRVTVNGEEVPRAAMEGGEDGWTFYADTSSVYFGGNVFPDYGVRIEVSYNLICP